jgi:uncharacterized lipoprotein
MKTAFLLLFAAMTAACSTQVETERPPCDGYSFAEVAKQPECELGKSLSCTFHYPNPEGPSSVTFTCQQPTNETSAHFYSD